MKNHRSQPARSMLLHSGVLLVSLSAITGLSWIWGLQLLTTDAATEPYATGIPWLETKADCEHTGRVWQDDVCWDNEHDPTF